MNRRILFIIEDFFPLGSNLQLQPVVAALAADTFDVHIASLCNSARPPAWITDLPATLHKLEPGRGINRVLQLRLLISNIGPDVLHAWGHATHWSSMIAGMGRRELKIIVSYFEIPPRRRLIQRGSEAWLFRRAVNLTAAHPSIAHRLEEDGVDQKVEIIPNCNANLKTRIPVADHVRNAAQQRLFEIISSEIQQPALPSITIPTDAGRTEPGLSGDSKLFLIGTVARLLPVYQLKDLVWAVDLLCCIRNDIHLFIFGSGDQESGLRRFISKTASQQHIHLVAAESTDENDLAALDCYWNAQLEEPIPSAMLAAMAQKIPVVSVLGPGTADLLIPLRSGLATNFGARDEFARWTKYLIEQTDAACQLADQGAVHVKKRFPASQMIEGYRKLYATIEE